MDIGDITRNATMATLDKSALNLSKVDAAALDFEAMFVSEMMKPMFEGLETDGMFGGGKTEEVFRSLLLQEYGKEIAASGQLGIAGMIRTEMLAMQEEAGSHELAQNMQVATKAYKGE